MYTTNNRTSFAITALFSLLTLALVSSQAMAYQPIDKVIAIIGDDVIFSSELEQQVNQSKKRLEARGQTFSSKRLQQQLLDNLILKQLQLNLAKRNKISASDEEINNAIKNASSNLAKQGISFEQHLKSQSLTLGDARKELAEDIIINKIQQGAVNQRISITDTEIDNFLNSKEGKEWLTPRFHLGHIFLPKSEGSKALKQANALYQQLQNRNNDFSDFARQYSKGPNASKGGDIGIQTKEDLPELFANRIHSLRVGDISQPFESDAGVHILKLFARNGAEPVVVDQYKVRHILIKEKELFTAEEAKAKIDLLYENLLAGADFAELAEIHTDDIGSKLDGGSLGWSLPKVFVPEFERVMVSTPTGTFSKPFLSQFGWHILKNDSKRRKDIFEKVKRDQVKKLIISQRFNDELQIWLQELRDNAYVEVLI